MASSVSISNLALAHLGDEAVITSIDPPEDSQQAEHCARFYPIARNTVLESHAWGFATRRKLLVPLVIADADMPPGWTFAYQRPVDCLKALGIVSPVAAGTTVFTLPPSPDPVIIGGDEISEEFIEESQDDDNLLIYTNAEEATLKYIALVEDTTKYSTFFVNAVARLLASMLAGPIIKGTEGMKVSVGHLKQYYEVDLPLARSNDANARHKNTYRDFLPSSMAARQ